jgi:hypothetical protein
MVTGIRRLHVSFTKFVSSYSSPLILILNVLTISKFLLSSLEVNFLSIHSDLSYDQDLPPPCKHIHLSHFLHHLLIEIVTGMGKPVGLRSRVLQVQVR